MKKLSVIIVSYNEKQYLPQAIDSCLNQNLDGDFEIIIGDDGSDDGSIDLIVEYAGKYPDIIKYFVMDRSDAIEVIPSLRVSNIIKKAASIAEGKYIDILSGDDYFCDKNKFKKQIDYLENPDNQDVVACISGYKKFWPDGKELLLENTGGICQPRAIFWSGTYIHISAFLFRKEVFTSEYLLSTFCEDTGLVYSLACIGKWHYNKEVMFAYRQRNSSITDLADELELRLSELLLYEECDVIHKFRLSNMARFYLPLKYCYKNKQKINDEKYKKYLNLSSKYEKDILKILRDWSGVSQKERNYYKKIMFISGISRIGFRTVARVYKILFNCIR